MNMKLVVQKYGGTSLGGENGRTRALLHVQRAYEAGYKVVVVVSAMGRLGDPYATDSLLSLVGGKRTTIRNRELDLLMSCGEIISAVVFANDFLKIGLKTSVFTGGQAGILTNSEFRNACIVNVNTEKLLTILKRVDVVIVAGFQGIDINGDITTIGRGGSDTTAMILGSALGAEVVDIFTDVNGIMTADPRLTSLARSLTTISYNEICDLANEGAKVIHPYAVEVAMNTNLPVRIRSTYLDEPGTLLVKKPTPSEEKRQERLITGIANVSQLAQIQVEAKENELDLQSSILQAIGQAKLCVDFINIYPSGMQFTVADDDVDKVKALLSKREYTFKIEPECAKVAVISANTEQLELMTSKVVATLAIKGIEILQSVVSCKKILVLIKEKYLQEAVHILHEVFQFYLEPINNLGNKEE